METYTPEGKECTLSCPQNDIGTNMVASHLGL